MWPQQRSSFSAVWDVTRRYDATAREPLRRFCSSVECDGDPGAQQDSRCSSVAIMSTTPNRTPPHRTKAVASAEAPCYWRRAGLLASWRELSGIAWARYSPVCFLLVSDGWFPRRSGGLARAQAAVGLLNAATSLRAS